MKKIYLLLTVIILTLSCQKEEFVEEIIVVENSQIQKNTVSKQEILGNPELMYALNAAHNKISPTRKNMKSGTGISTSELHVDLENVVRLTKESYTSYTFPVVRENKYIENLLVSLQENGTYRTLLIRYSINEFERKALKNDEYIDLTKKAEITLLEGSFPTIKSWNKSAETCYNIDVNTVVETCDWTEKHTYEEILAGEKCNDPTPPRAPVYYISFTPDNCDSESSGGGEEPDPTPLNPGGDPITTDPDPEPGGDLTTPLLPTDEYLLERFFTSLSNDQKSWIFDGNLPWINNEIVPFLKTNDFSVESKTEGKMRIDAERARDGNWNFDDTGTYLNRASLKYKASFYPSPGSKMYLLENDLVLFATSTERFINPQEEINIASSELRPGVFHYLHSYETARWYEYQLPREYYPSADIDFLLEGFWDGVKIFGRYATPLEDVIILIDGKDFDGELANQYHAGGLLFASLIPGGKILKAVAKVTKGTTAWKFTAKYGDEAVTLSFKVINGVVDFGSRSRLANVIKTTSLEEAHHILPWTRFKANQVIQEAAYSGFHMNSKVNGRALQKYTALTGDGLHGNHPAYDDVVAHLINEFKEETPNFTSETAKAFLENTLIPQLNRYIDEASNSGQNLNSFFRDIIKPRLGVY